MSEADRGEFDCTAYGPEGRELGALCFISSELGKRMCASQAECAAVMDAERRRVFARIQELASQGDPVGIDLAEAFTDPGQLLGGGTGAADDGGQEGNE
jgi:hypothetical protein